MSQMCHLPNCNNRAPSYSLFKVPSKKFCKKNSMIGQSVWKKLYLVFVKMKALKVYSNGTWSKFVNVTFVTRILKQVSYGYFKI